MFTPPPKIIATAFARLPDKFRIKDRVSQWAFGKANTNLHSFLEGPCFDKNGTLYISDVAFGRIFKVSKSGEFELFIEYDGEPNGMACRQDGVLFIADHRNGIVSVNPKTREVEIVLPRLKREGFKGLNDLIFDSQGNLFFNDQGQTGMHDPTGRVYRMTTGGHVTCLVNTVPSPNGMALSVDEKTLFVSATRANQVWRIPLNADGSCGKVGVHLHMQGGLTGPDGLAVDVQGNLSVSQCGTGIIWLFNIIGEPILRIDCPIGIDVSAQAYGGPNQKTLFITEAQSGTILQAKMDVAGKLLI